MIGYDIIMIMILVELEKEFQVLNLQEGRLCRTSDSLQSSQVCPLAFRVRSLTAQFLKEKQKKESSAYE